MALESISKYSEAVDVVRRVLRVIHQVRKEYVASALANLTLLESSFNRGMWNFFNQLVAVKNCFTAKNFVKLNFKQLFSTKLLNQLCAQ